MSAEAASRAAGPIEGEAERLRGVEAAGTTLTAHKMGEMLVFSAADFEDFLEPRPDLPSRLETDLEGVVSLLATNRWPFRLHATYDESITRFLNVFEQVNRSFPLQGLH